MPSVRQPASALRDRAERHVFELLPELGAVERRALALVELAELELPAAARDLGIEEDALAEALFRARRDLRRARVPLAGGSRCERAERLISERSDTALQREDRKWVEIHLARCPRCIEHEAELAVARDELRASFVTEPPAPEPPEPQEGNEGRGRLRVVPPPAPESAPPPAVGGKKHPRGTLDRPTLSPAAMRAAKIVAIVLAILGMLLGLGLGTDVFSGL
jgi:hypothetical protein